MFKKILISLMAIGVIGTVSINSSYIVNAKPTAASTSTSYSFYGLGRITGTNVNIRSGAGTNFSSYGFVQKGDLCGKIIGIQPNNGIAWVKVKMLSGKFKGKVGYVAEKYVS